MLCVLRYYLFPIPCIIISLIFNTTVSDLRYHLLVISIWNIWTAFGAQICFSFYQISPGLCYQSRCNEELCLRNGLFNENSRRKKHSTDPLMDAAIVQEPCGADILRGSRKCYCLGREQCSPIIFTSANVKEGNQRITSPRDRYTDR